MMVSEMAMTAEMPPSLLEMEGKVVALTIPLRKMSSRERSREERRAEKLGNSSS
jgi:hypothetical protein